MAEPPVDSETARRNGTTMGPAARNVFALYPPPMISSVNGQCLLLWEQVAKVTDLCVLS